MVSWPSAGLANALLEYLKLMAYTIMSGIVAASIMYGTYLIIESLKKRLLIRQAVKAGMGSEEFRRMIDGHT